MASSTNQAVTLSQDIDSITTLYSEATAYLTKLTAQLEALETTQTALLHSYHSTSTALADIHAYNTVAPIMEQVPVYAAKVAKLKQTMQQQSLQVDKMKRKAEDLRKIKKSNNERLKRRWQEEKELDRGLAAKMASPSAKEHEITEYHKETGSVERSDVTATPPQDTSKLEQDLEIRPEGSVISMASTASTSTESTAVATVKSIVKRKKKPRRAEIE